LAAIGFAGLKLLAIHEPTSGMTKENTETFPVRYLKLKATVLTIKRWFSSFPTGASLHKSDRFSTLYSFTSPSRNQYPPD
jgi:hypothetical protein